MKTLEVMNSLENFGSRELNIAIELLNDYDMAGVNDRAYLPETWSDDGVYLDFNSMSGKVFLANSDYQTLMTTDYGLMMWYNTPYYGNEGTLFDLTRDFQHDTSNDDYEPLPMSEWRNWNAEDASYLYSVLDDDIVALRDTKADLTDLYRVKDLIVEMFINENLPTTLEYLKDTGDDWEIQLQDDDWWIEQLGEQLLTVALTDFDNEIHDTDDLVKYLEYLRVELQKLTQGEHYVYLI